MSEAKSKFAGRFDPSANAINRRPAITGTFAMASEQAGHSFRAWSGISEGGRMYLRGTHEPEDVSAALKAQHAEIIDAAGPPNISLKPGELVMFENATRAEGEKRPNWYGFARLTQGYVKLSAWDRKSWNGGKWLTGTVEPYRPGEQSSASTTALTNG